MKKKVILGFLSLVLSLGAFAQFPNYAYGTGYWNVGTTWMFGVPTTDALVIISNATVTVPSGCNAECNELNLYGNGALVIENGASLDVSETFGFGTGATGVSFTNYGTLNVGGTLGLRAGGTYIFAEGSTTTADEFKYREGDVTIAGTIKTDVVNVLSGVLDLTSVNGSISAKTEGGTVVYNVAEGAVLIESFNVLFGGGTLTEDETLKTKNVRVSPLGGTANLDLADGDDEGTDVDITVGKLTLKGASFTVDAEESLTSLTNIESNSTSTITNNGNLTAESIIINGTFTCTEGSTTTADVITFAGTNASLAGTIQADEIIITKGTVDFSNATLTNKAGTGTPNIIIGENATVSYLPANVTVTYQRSIAANKWTFVGLPHAENIQPLTTLGTDNVWALAFNYQSYDWDTEYLHVWDNGTADDLTDDQYDGVQRGHGIFVFSEVAAKLNILSSYITGVESVSMPENAAAKTAAEGRWFALSNPNNTPLDIANFLSANSNNVNGGVVYTYSGTSFGAGEEEGTIAVGEGFFVNMQDSKSTVTFQTGAKATSNPKEYITLSVSTDGYKEAVKFASNDEASTSYDRFDANKMFGNGTVAEPYLVCEGINLCKEVVDILPYTATMNVRSQEARSVEISADRIPEAYTLVLVDGAQEIELSEGDVYETTLAEGENADRFSLKIGKSAVSIQDVAKAEELSIRNNNRIITVNGGNNISVEVYNALGQKVYETNQRTFELGGVAAGAYVVKAKSEGVAHSSKIVVR